MLKPTLEQAKEYTGYSVIPVCREILSDFTTPIEVLKKLRAVSRHVYILESVENQEKWGRYTFLGYNPKLEITCINGELTVKDVLTGTAETSKQSHPADYIKGLMAQYSSPKIDGLPSFTGGLVGYFSYDYIKYSEPTLNLDAEDEEHFKDVDLMLFDKVIAFDNIHQKIVLITNISADNIDSEYAKAEKDLAEMEQLIRYGKPADIPHGKLTSGFRKLFDKDQYCAMVEKAKHYIYEGDIFQVVLSNRLDADFDGSLLSATRDESVAVHVLLLQRRHGDRRSLPGDSGEARERHPPYISPRRNTPPRRHGRGGQAPGNGTPPRREGTFRAQHAG